MTDVAGTQAGGIVLEARSVLLVTVVAALALVGLLLTVASSGQVQHWPGQDCADDPGHPATTSTGDCLAP